MAAELRKRREPHERMRALIAWLVTTRFGNKQSDLCKALGIAPALLSGYKTGKTTNGKEMLFSALDQRRS